MLIPNAQFYYVAPFYNQAAEILWHSGVLPNFLGRHKDKYVKNTINDGKRIVLHNGSFIKLVGSDNYEAGRGFNPDGGVYDEFKDHDKRFDDGFRPNLISKKAPLAIFGTPPGDEDHFFCRTEEEFKEHPSGLYLRMPTYSNPHIDRAELEIERKAYAKRGELSIYLREYEAEIVPGGAGSIFPMLEIPRRDQTGNFESESRHVKNYQVLLDEVQRTYRDWEFFALYDPGSAVCFAVIFIAVNKFSRKIYALDEIYETDGKKTTGKQIYRRSTQKMQRICDRVNWIQVYDYAAAWFYYEVQNEFDVGLTPCHKDIKNKEFKLSVIKDFLLEDLFIISTSCQNLIKEMSLYATDQNGNIPKKNDHAIDCIRYGFSAANLDTVPKNRKIRLDDGRIWTPEQDEIFEDEALNRVNIYDMEQEFFNDDDIL